jgi:hypothetical protein
VEARPGQAFDAIGRFSRSGAAMALVGAWAFGEAIVLPVVPDVALALFALAAPRRAAPLFGAVLVGAVAGSIVLAAAASAAPRSVDAMLLALPGIDADTIATVDARLATDGVLGFAQFGPGPPLKVYTVEWMAAGGSWPWLILGVLLNRVTRIGPVVLVAALAGRLFPGWLRRHERLVIPGYAVAWTAFYAIYWR